MVVSMIICVMYIYIAINSNAEQQGLLSLLIPIVNTLNKSCCLYV